MRMIILSLTLFALLGSVAGLFGGAPAPGKEGKASFTGKDKEFLRHSDVQRNVSYRIPSDWESSYSDLGYLRVHRIWKGKASIDVHVRVREREHLVKWNRWKSWYMQNTGRLQVTIVDRGNLIPERERGDRLIIIQYRNKRGTWLERLKVTYRDETMVVVTCRAPLRNFKDISETCDAVMGSVRFSML